jgi:hypothetical protein
VRVAAGAQLLRASIILGAPRLLGFFFFFFRPSTCRPSPCVPVLAGVLLPFFKKKFERLC